jgi:hypothetical protein
MIAATIPEDCRVLDRAADLPAPVSIDIGLYACPRALEESRYLANFIIRQTDLSRL